MQPTKASFSAAGVRDDGRVEIIGKSCCSKVVQVRGAGKYCEGSYVILVKEDSFYEMEAKFEGEYDNGCCAPYELRICNATTDTVLSKVTAWPCEAATIKFEGVLEHDTVIVIEVHTSGAALCVFKLHGCIDVNIEKYIQVITLETINTQDANLKINYIIYLSLIHI